MVKLWEKSDLFQASLFKGRPPSTAVSQEDGESSTPPVDAAETHVLEGPFRNARRADALSLPSVLYAAVKDLDPASPLWQRKREDIDKFIYAVQNVRTWR
jgi:hypothetical protein